MALKELLFYSFVPEERMRAHWWRDYHLSVSYPTHTIYPWKNNLQYVFVD